MIETYTTVQAEASLCAWEWMNDRYNQQDVSEGPVSDMLELWENAGTSAMRHLAIGLGPAIDAFYQNLVRGYGEAVRTRYQAYDLEFVPAILSNLDWAHEMRKVAGNVGPVNISEQAKVEVEFEIWSLMASNAAARQWGYEGLVSEDPGSARRAFNAGLHPADYVDEAGRESDLFELDEWTARSLAEGVQNYDNDRLRAFREQAWQERKAASGNLSSEPACLIFGVASGEYYLAIEVEPFKGDPSNVAFLDDAEAYGPFADAGDVSVFIAQNRPEIVSYQFAPTGAGFPSEALNAVAARANDPASGPRP